MASENQSQLQLIPTPNPKEFMVRLSVPDRIINENLRLLPGGALLEQYTPYKNIPWIAVPPRVKEFGEYRYVKADKQGEGYTGFYFAKPRTKKEKNTPFQEWSDTQSYVWPAVLLGLYIIKSTYPISNYNGSATQNTTRYFARMRYVNATQYESLVRIRQYLSDTPWDDADLQHMQPVPTPISTSYLGLVINIPRCLHKKVVFPELIPGAQIVLGAGMEGSDRFGTPREQVFPATQFTGWTPFILHDKQIYTNGMFLREQVEIFPPPVGLATKAPV